MSTSATGRRVPRLAGIDLARGVALVLMFVAHVAPSDGPLRVLLLSEFLTAPLFAMLVGIGADLAQDRVAPVLGARAFLGRQLIRAAALVALGWWLAQSLAQIVIVLVPLGLLMVVCLPLAQVRTRWLAGLGVLFTVVALALPMVVARLGPGAIGPGSWGEVAGRLGGWGPYRMTAFIAYAIAGMLLVRWLQSVRARPGRVLIAGLAAAVAMGLLLVATNVAGVVEVHAYDGTAPETLGNLCGSASIVLLCSWLAAQSWFLRLPRRLVDLLVAPGQMTLTLYCWQVVVLHWHGLVRPGERDDSWTMLVLLAGSSAALSTLWRLMTWTGLGERVSRGLHRGPVEGVVEGLAGALFPHPRMSLPQPRMSPRS